MNNKDLLKKIKKNNVEKIGFNNNPFKHIKENKFFNVFFYRGNKLLFVVSMKKENIILFMKNNLKLFNEYWLNESLLNDKIKNKGVIYI